MPVNIVEYAGPFGSDGRINRIAVYASDQWTNKRLTLSYGIRYDHFNAGTLAKDLPAGPFVGARHFDAASDIPNYNDITPRVGAAFGVELLLVRSHPALVSVFEARSREVVVTVGKKFGASSGIGPYSGLPWAK